MNELLFVVALIVMIQGGKPVGTATGFFYVRDNVLYFVTNRHVVLDESRGVKPELLRLGLHRDPSDLTQSVEYEIPLYVGGKPRWHVHADYASTPIDIAVIQLDRPPAGAHVKALNAGNFLPEKFVVNPGEDVMLVGFPRGFSDTRNNLPLVRNALVSSAYGINFDGAPIFLVDANLHPGMSGSPVLTKPKNIWPDRDGNTNMLTGSPTYFLGVFSASVSVKVTATTEEALGLGAVWYGRLIEEIISTIK